MQKRTFFHMATLLRKATNQTKIKSDRFPRPKQNFLCDFLLSAVRYITNSNRIDNII